MLPEKFKFHFQNESNVQLDFNGNSSNEIITVKFRLWKFTSAGALSWSTEQSLTYTATDVADAAGAEFSEYDNGTNLYLGLVGNMTVQTDNAGATGFVQLLVEWPTDGSTYPSDAANFVRTQDLIGVSQVKLGGAQTRRVPFSLCL